MDRRYISVLGALPGLTDTSQSSEAAPQNGRKSPKAGNVAGALPCPALPIRPPESWSPRAHVSSTRSGHAEPGRRDLHLTNRGRTRHVRLVRPRGIRRPTFPAAPVPSRMCPRFTNRELCYRSPYRECAAR
jgi:hypothetical protein